MRYYYDFILGQNTADAITYVENQLFYVTYNNVNVVQVDSCFCTFLNCRLKKNSVLSSLTFQRNISFYSIQASISTSNFNSGSQIKIIINFNNILDVFHLTLF